MKTLLTIKNLEKSYGTKKVINKLSFDVQKGEILCILGPNGAGKSTTINILTGTASYESGEIKSNGHNISQDLISFKKHLGIVPQDLALYEDLTAWQNIIFFASLYGLKGSDLKKRCTQALEFTGLLDHRGDKVQTFSGGMKRRLNIACAIAHSPDLLIMDEPTVGIDPQSRNHILDSIRQLKETGVTIIYTTHYMEEVEEISTRIIIMDKGEIMASGTKEELKEDVANEKHIDISLDSTDGLNLHSFYKIEGVKQVKKKSDTLLFTTLKGIENLDRIIACIISQGKKINNISCQTASLETVFLN